MSFGPFRILRLFARGSECAELRKRASDYLEADISEQERERIRQHLEECENCKSFVETLRSTIAMLGDLPSRAIPQYLKDKLLQIPKEQGRGPQ